MTFAAPVEIAGKSYVGIVIANELKEPKKGRHRFYLHEVILQKNLLNEELKTRMDTGSKQGDVSKVLKEIVTAKENKEKFEENIEDTNDLSNMDAPRVVPTGRENTPKVVPQCKFICTAGWL